MDYKIKFEYKGIGKQAAGIRSKVLQAQKKGGETGPSGERQTLSSLKTLNTSIQKLIASNKLLITAIHKSSGMRPGGGGGGGGGLGGFGGAGGVGRIGASIPVAGALIAGAGFLMSKINQIGKAYIQRKSEQFGNVGIAGDRVGTGPYLGAQMGAGMKAYAQGTGKFADTEKGTGKWKKNKNGKWYEETRFTTRPNQTALDVGAVYGMSAEETLGTAGRFRRAGASYREATHTALGSGIQTELPTFLAGVADILTDAVKDGINTSDMTKDMAKEISALTMRTAGKNVDAALKIIGGFKSAKDQVGGGKVGTFQGLVTAQASQDLLMEKLTGKDSAGYRESLKNIATKEELDKLATLKPGAKFSDLAALTPSLAHPLLRQHTLDTGEVNLQKKMRENINTQFKGIKGRRAFKNIATEQGFMGMTDPQIETWLSEDKIETDPSKVQKKGKGVLGAKTKTTMESAPGLSIDRMQQLEGLLFTYGDSFASATLKVEQSMLTMANKIAPTIVTTLEDAMSAMEKFGGGISKLNTYIDELAKKSGLERLKTIGKSLYNTVRGQ